MGLLTALAGGDRFSIIAFAAKSVARHRRYLRQMGLVDRLARERPLEMSVPETGRSPASRQSVASSIAQDCREARQSFAQRDLEVSWG